MATRTRKASKKTRKTTKTEKAVKTIKTYEGAPIPANRVLRRTMNEFKNCSAFCWLIINEKGGTYTFANSYNGDLPKISYDPKHYTYELNEKALKHLEAKIDRQGYEEIEVTDWPTWITSAARRKSSK